MMETIRMEECGYSDRVDMRDEIEECELTVEGEELPMLSGPDSLLNGACRDVTKERTPPPISAHVVVVDGTGSPLPPPSPLTLQPRRETPSPRPFHPPPCVPLFTQPGVHSVDSKASVVNFTPAGKQDDVTILIVDNVEDIEKLQLSTDATLHGKKAIDGGCVGPVCWCAVLSILCHLAFLACTGLIVWQAPLRIACEQPDVPPPQLLDSDYVYSDGFCYTPSEYNQTTLICACVFLVVSFFLILMEALVSDTSSYVHNFMNNEQAKEFCEGLRNALPVITWTAQCYHYETRKRPGGKSHEEKVITHRDSQRFHYGHSQDVSGELPHFLPATVTRVDFEVAWGFNNKASADRYKYFKEKFKQRNEGLDLHFDFEERVELDGFEDRIAVFQKKSGRSMLMRAQYYWLCTCLLLTWPYRAWFRASSVKVDFLFVKKITV